MRLGLCGYPLSGKTTVFHILSPSPHSGHEHELGFFELPDPWLDELFQWAGASRKTPARIELWDPPSHISMTGASAPRFMAELRKMDGLIHMVPEFHGDIDILSRIEEVERTFITMDIQLLEARYAKIQEQMRKRKDDELLEESQVIHTLLNHLQQEKPLRSDPWPFHVMRHISGYGLLSLKPVLHLINFHEMRMELEHVEEILTLARKSFPSCGFTFTSARLEKELLDMEGEERKEWMEMYGLTDILPERIVEPLLESYHLIRFYTVKGNEVRAWLLEKGSNAVQAAGKIHTDMAKGFIRAEVLHARDTRTVQSWDDAKHQGKVRVEGKDYVVQDRDILMIRFSV